jgi:hypothetical protein
LRDTIPNLKSILGLESKVMNYRPLEKAKHVSKVHFRYGGTARTQNEKFQEASLRSVSNYMDNRDVGLPALNLKQARINRVSDSIRKRVLFNSVSIQSGNAPPRDSSEDLGVQGSSSHTTQRFNRDP